MFAGADTPRRATGARRASSARCPATIGTHPPSRHASDPTTSRPPTRPSAASRPQRAREDGFALIEVVISALLVALIAIAILNGFDVAAKTANDNRLHDQAAVLAAQSQEALRSDPVSALDLLQTEPHVYTRTIGTETFTITQEAQFVNGSTGSAGCTATASSESSAGGEYVRVASTVDWTQLKAAGRPPLRQASIITPPDGSALEVDVTDGKVPANPIEGAIVRVDGVQTTTGADGCVIYGSIPSTSVELEVEKHGYVTPSGAEGVKVSEVGIAPNLTTHYAAELAAPGRIEAHYTYKGANVYEGSTVEGDTFVAANAEMGLSPNFELGGTPSTFDSTALTANNLFPLSEQWSVYAGDCPTDSPARYSGGSSFVKTVAVPSGGTATVSVPLSHVSLSVYTGTEPGKPGSLASTRYPVTIEDSECAEVLPDNATTADVAHTQETTTSGHLTHPFQPFGRWALCLYDATTKQTYTVPYENTTESGNTFSIYLGASGTKSGTTRNGVTIASEQSANTC